MNTIEAIERYNEAPSYKLVLVLKDCKLLLKLKPDTKHNKRIANTISLIKQILIDRQVIC